MTEIERQIEELSGQLAEMRKRHEIMSREMIVAEGKLEKLRTVVLQKTNEGTIENVAINASANAAPGAPYDQEALPKIERKPAIQHTKPLKTNRELEDFIGINIISKIGILVTIAGVFIGAKYAIDNQLISPLMRIVSGYLFAVAFVFVALRLKNKYEYFSSVLVGGGLAIAYFITYIAYSFYNILPLMVAFASMVVITSAAVGFALWYDQKIIALLGQVAAYAIPFLLGNGHGNIFTLFTYIAVINIGLLLLSFKKDWKILYHIAFFLTWIIYVFSIAITNSVAGNFSATMTFLGINFFTFYVTFLSNKIFKKELYQLGEIAIVLLNALFFFFLGAFLIDQNFDNLHSLTWFTTTNAIVHFIAGFLIFRLHLVDKTVYQFILGLGLLFITIAIPVELNGSWVTLLWTLEATTLFYLAYNSQRAFYLDIALPLVIIAFISLLQDWWNAYPYLSNLIANPVNKTSFFNINFALSLFVCACFGFISYTAGKRVLPDVNSFSGNFFSKLLPVAFLAILYLALFNEIHFAWDNAPIQKNLGNISISPNNGEILQSICLIIYSCLYIAFWLFFNVRSIKKDRINYLLSVFGLIVNVVYLINGLYLIGKLRDNYLSKDPSDLSEWLFVVRYFSFIVLAVLWISGRKAMNAFESSLFVQRSFSSVFNITLLVVICNEFIHWMDLSGYQNQYKLGLSLICGTYAIILLFTGITQKKKHLRLMAIALFSVTLLKLFFYDLSSLSTISKTIVLVMLGTFLLVASFLYNKYKGLLSGKEEN